MATSDPVEKLGDIGHLNYLSVVSKPLVNQAGEGNWVMSFYEPVGNFGLGLSCPEKGSLCPSQEGKRLAL